MIFISHSTKNEVIAKEIRDELQAQGYQCFLSGDDLKADDDWHEEILRALRGCSAFLGVVTQEFCNSAFCQQEMGAALALEKPRLLILVDGIPPPGFAARFQACKRSRLVDTLGTSRRYRQVRVRAWISAVRTARSYSQANDAHNRFAREWEAMEDAERLDWLLAAAANSQVRDEGFKAGPFFKRVRNELQPLLTDQWLYENDTEGTLHDRSVNPIANPPAAARKKGEKGVSN